MKHLLFISSLLIGFFFLFYSCNDPVPEKDASGKIVIVFHHLIDQNEIEFDTLQYINAAMNKYLVNEIQYFISDIILYRNDGDSILIDDWKDIHYVDTDIPSTHRWEVLDPITIGQYDSVSFRFGITEEKNQSFMFVNSPERDMFWPEYLGGGYHYMKLNGKWKEDEQSIQLNPFDFHLGIGQIYDAEDNITAFIHNDFRVSIPDSDFYMDENDSIEIHLKMNVENWFKEPFIYDHNQWGSDIMQEQEAMAMACKNGFNVFSISFQ